MIEFIQQVFYLSHELLLSHDFLFVLVSFFPIIMLIEMPFYAIVIAGTIRHYYVQYHSAAPKPPYYPSVSIIVTCYNEGEELRLCLRSLVEQIYPGKIEILVAIDPSGNDDTAIVAREVKQLYRDRKDRPIKILEKQTRGGHASSMNLGLNLGKGVVLINVDGDSSCDNDMVATITCCFLDENVVGVSGGLRVRNVRDSLWTRFQTIEYMFGIQLNRVGLGQLNIMNNISGAFGAYRRKFLRKIGGWNNGTAEDLDLTFRIHSYFRRHPKLKLISSPTSILHTEVPNTLLSLLKQRLQWDGDLYYIYCRRHWRSFRPKFLGWRSFVGMLWYGLLFQIVLPLTILSYLIYLFAIYSYIFVFSVLFITYLYYLLILMVFFYLHIFLVSERKKQDLKLFWVLFLMPGYQLGMRVFSAFAIIYEMIALGHKGTTMAPWWVIKKTK